MSSVTLSTSKSILTLQQKAQEALETKSQQVGWLNLLLKDLYHLVESQNSQITYREIQNSGNSLFPCGFSHCHALFCSPYLVLLSSSVPQGFGTGHLAPAPFQEQPTTKIALQVAGLLFIIYQSVIWNANPCGICLGQGEIIQEDTQMKFPLLCQAQWQTLLSSS